MPRMSCSMTTPQVEDRSKTVTRRATTTWRKLKVGDRVTLIEKGMGLKRGEKQRVLAEVEIVSVRIEPLGKIADPGELSAEGFPDATPAWFRSFWACAHGFGHIGLTDLAAIKCRRIEWRYL